MEKAKFTVYGEPKGKGRPRFNTKTGHAITPKDTVSYENLVKLEWQTAYGTESFPKEAMLDMRIKAYYRIPKSASKKKRAAMLAGEIRPTKKPDMDNVVKIIADSLNNLAEVLLGESESRSDDYKFVEGRIGGNSQWMKKWK